MPYDTPCPQETEMLASDIMSKSTPDTTTQIVEALRDWKPHKDSLNRYSEPDGGRS